MTTTQNTQPYTSIKLNPATGRLAEQLRAKRGLRSIAALLEQLVAQAAKEQE